ncbi:MULTISPECIES: sensor histidine kinase [Arenibacter]|uniref:sensor histidine kinase n=1 Tax=Arenibacter TaxID=178469 RepID=UPI000A3913CA|nr:MULTISPECIES: histidine kinase [Arenibacter]
MPLNDGIDQLLNHNTSRDYRINYKHHLVFWLVYFVFNTLRWTSLHNDFEYSLKTNLLGFPIHMALAYFNVYYLMPKFVYTKKYVKFTLLILSSLFVMLLVKYNLTYYLVSTDVWPEGPENATGLTLNYAITTMLGELYVIAFVTAIKVTIDWLNESNKLHELEKRQLTTELKFLKSQVSPHFFFNTLNNIYALSLEKSDRAPQIIIKLSELMRYLLYGTKKNHQELGKELNCIENYVDLERIRFDESLRINFNISGDPTNKTIAPMLLIPLVENCFKHGANKNIGEMDITIDIVIEESFLYFKAINTIPENKTNLIPLTKEGGIGLENVKKRLELGYAPEDYHLSIFEKDKTFNVILKLKVQ